MADDGLTKRPNYPNPEPQRRRRRPPVACELCRRRKIKCNREAPCSNCRRSKNATCIYKELSPPPTLRNRDAQRSSMVVNVSNPGENCFAVQVDGQSTSGSARTVSSHPPMSTAPSSMISTPMSHSSIQETESLRSRISELEQQLSASRQQSVVNTPSPHYNISTTTSHIAGTFHVHQESATAGQPPAISRTIMHKTRVFGQSHWMNGAAQFAEILDIIEPYIQSETSNTMRNLQRCKYLGKVIKAKRTPAWPCPPTTELPPKEIADVLIDNYLRTFESVYRVLHIPTFKREYESLMSTETPNMSFMVQLKLVLAIGATIYDDHFSMRVSAIRWIHEAQTWISEPEFKSRLGIPFLQTQILLILAREIVGVEGAMVWVATGELIRVAVHMGLNRDPTFLPKLSSFSREMRRRLWNTILEIALHTSMESGGPPMISLEDFNTQPPSNLDDEALDYEDATSEPETVFTQTSVPLALRKMFPLRLAILKALNGIAAHAGYEDTLRMDAELRSSYRFLCRTLQGYKSSDRQNAPSEFQTRILDFLYRRYLSSLHMPFFGAATRANQYAFSRMVVVEASWTKWHTIFPFSPSRGSIKFDEKFIPSKPDDLTRLALCSSGTFRTNSIQAAFLIAAELKALLQEEDSLGTKSLPPHLVSTLEEAKRLSLRSIEAGETNVKGYLFLCLVHAQVEGLIRGISRTELPELVIRAADEAEERCLRILEANVQSLDSMGAASNVLDEMPIEPLPDVLADWSLMMPDTHFNLGGTDSMNWLTMDSLASCYQMAD
ncbi:hypothetical protein N7532_000986 [Penicillium argentinense]|uniref:Zn(2)-C6 fungal-type domain-containing protein n=1 Tax=Penicillium argentinense TaxID=1131581 RepID=A0A9W9G1V1_9EURO|nr:uncharacterized protein N7532_000986 [Penicillium argentinense]KAJ5110451.1 hypothetical protein N7532_000986 [Penicillium argentinense]